jgi:DNA-directed RNA polymerase subunit alpha
MKRAGVIEWPLEDLELTVRPYSLLKREGVDTIGQLVAMSDEELLSVHRLKAEDVVEIRSALRQHEREWRYKA